MEVMMRAAVASCTRVARSNAGSWGSGRACVFATDVRAMTCTSTSTSSVAWSHGRGREEVNGGGHVVERPAAATRMFSDGMLLLQKSSGGAGMGGGTGYAARGEDHVSHTHGIASGWYARSSMFPLLHSTTLTARPTMVTTTLSSAPVVQQQQQRRWVLNVPVLNNNIEAASRKLKRLSLAEGDKREEKKRRAFIKPSVRAKMQAKAKVTRMAKRAFREKVKFLLSKRERGF